MYAATGDVNERIGTKRTKGRKEGRKETKRKTSALG